MTSVILPKQNQKIQIGADVLFEIQAADWKIDSVRIQAGDVSSVFMENVFSWIPPTKKTGLYKMQLSVYYKGKEEIHYPRLTLLSDIEPAQYTYIVLGAYPHNTDDYTQGLFFLNDQMIESTGQRGKSALKKIEQPSGKTVAKIPLDDQYFGEGCTRYKNEIYQLTWEARKGFVYDLNLNEKRIFQYNTDGWGLTTMGDSLVMSDGTEKLYFMTPGSFSEIDRIEVYSHEGAVDNLNELEYVNGLIFANEYQTNFIHVIEPSSGRVLKTIDLSDLLTDKEAQKADVLNGIAYDEMRDRLFVTGKWWPWLFEIKLQPKKNSL